jgi:hypothetical protein
MYCQILVSPGIGAVLQTTFLRNVFIMEDFPVFGYPMKPTETCFLSEWRSANCRSKAIKEPLPKEFVIDEWNAKVGFSLDR